MSIMKKFRVVEEGRNLTYKEMSKTCGGACSDTTQLASCSSVKFFTCTPCAWYMICTDSQFSMCGATALETCKGTQRVTIDQSKLNQ